MKNKTALEVLTDVVSGEYPDSNEGWKEQAQFAIDLLKSNGYRITKEPAEGPTWTQGYPEVSGVYWTVNPQGNNPEAVRVWARDISKVTFWDLEGNVNEPITDFFPACWWFGPIKAPDRAPGTDPFNGLTVTEALVTVYDLSQQNDKLKARVKELEGQTTEESPIVETKGDGTDTQGLDLDDIESAASIVGSCGYSELSDRLRAHAGTKPNDPGTDPVQEGKP